jgi:hypothetical protein
VLPLVENAYNCNVHDVPDEIVVGKIKISVNDPVKEPPA